MENEYRRDDVFPGYYRIVGTAKLPVVSGAARGKASIPFKKQTLDEALKIGEEK